MHQWFLPTLSEVLALAAGADRGSEAAAVGGQVAGNHAPNHSGSHRADRTDRQRLKAEREWCGAVAALNCLLQQEIAQAQPVSHKHPATHGLILSGPVPVLTHPVLASSVASWTFTSDPLNPALWLLGERHRHTMPLLPLPEGGVAPAPATPAVVPLLSDDPLTSEHFCALFTQRLSLVMVLGVNHSGEPAFQFSFDPEVAGEAWRSLRPRVLLTGGTEQLTQLDDLVERFAPAAPDYKTVMQFSQLLLKYLPEQMELQTVRREAPLQILPAASDASPEADLAANLETWEPASSFAGSSAHWRRLDCAFGTTGSKPEGARSADRIRSARLVNDPVKLRREALEHQLEQLRGGAGKESTEQCQPQDVELLQAIAHEVRTPLSTIRTLTRLLLKRKNLESDVRKRLEMIDRECSEQIDRFDLIFRAVELETSETKRAPVHLTSTSLAQVFNSCIPRWQKQASRRNLTLDVVLPQKMPPVVSDPTMLDQVLTGVIENFTASQPAGGHVQVQVILAGDQLKVQLQCQSNSSEKSPVTASTSPLKSIGQLLMFQPETGNLTLNLSVTKNLFQALGGKLIVRQRPQQGEVLTIFLPLE